MKYNHKGERCIYKYQLCQESSECSGCQIYLDRNKIQIIPEEEQSRRYKGDGGTNHTVNIPEYLYLLLKNDRDLENEIDKINNRSKENIKDKSYMHRPTHNTRVNRVLDNYYRKKYGDRFKDVINKLLDTYIKT